jgi:hypothetical protein
MSFTAQCPFCRVKLRGVPDSASGASSECPRCKNLFTLAATSEVAKGRQIPIEARSAVGANIPLPVVIAARNSTISPGPLADLVPASSGDESENPDAVSSRSLNPLGAISFFVATVALLAGSLSGVRFLVIALAAVGLLLGSGGLLVPWARKRGLLLPLAGLSVSLPVLALAVCCPGVLGLAAYPVRAEHSSDGPVARRLKPGKGVRLAEPTPSEWVDARQNAVEQAGVRVRVASVAVKAVKLKDASGQPRFTETGLVIKLRISNTGANRLIHYQSWGEREGDPAALPRLTDNRGKTYARKELGPALSVFGSVRTALLPPMKWVDDVLVFEATPSSIEYLRLELPCAAFAAPGKLQLQIPRQQIGRP